MCLRSTTGEEVLYKVKDICKDKVRYKYKDNIKDKYTELYVSRLPLIENLNMIFMRRLLGQGGQRESLVKR